MSSFDLAQSCTIRSLEPRMVLAGVQQGGYIPKLEACEMKRDISK